MNKAEQLIACLEGEIAKRDEELAAFRVAVENCEVFRARIAELEFELEVAKTDELSAAVWAATETIKHDLWDAQAELAALKAQDPVAWVGTIEDGVPLLVVEPQNWKATPLYAAPVSEAKAQGVVMLSRDAIREVFMRNGFTVKEGQADLKPYVYAAAEELLRLNAAPVVSGRNTMDAGVCVTDCRSSDGVAVGIIDAVITLARVFNGREVTPAVEEALIDLRADEDVISMISFTPVVSGQGVPDGYVLVPVELIEHVKHARKELCRLETAPLRARQKLAQKLTDLLAAAPSPAGVDGLDVVAWVTTGFSGKSRTRRAFTVNADDAARQHTNWTPHYRQVTTDQLCRLSDAQAIIDGLRGEVADLHTTMMAAAVEIQEHWAAHCDEEGYGPANLMHRLERGIASQYGYSAETLVRLESQRDQQAQRIGELDGLLLRVQVSLSIDDTEWGYSGAEKYKLLSDIRAALSSGKKGE